MDDKSSKIFYKILIVAKDTFVALFVVTFFSFIVAAVSVGGWWVVSNITTELAWVASFTTGLLFFSLWKSVSVRLKKTDRLKSEFITIAAHRIRTPLTRIRWMVSEIISGNGLAENKQLILSIDEIVKDLIEVSNKLLNAAEVGKSSLYYDYLFERGHFENIVRQVVAEYSIGAIQKDIKIVTNIADNIPEVSLDKERMKTVVSVFIENAIMYSSKNKTVEVKVLTENGDIVFSVKDSGIGIPKEDLPYIFSKFFRTKGAVSIDRDRAGLGLFIAKEIIKKHHGRVGVASEGVDKGSRFWARFPIS